MNVDVKHPTESTLHLKTISLSGQMQEKYVKKSIQATRFMMY